MFTNIITSIANSSILDETKAKKILRVHLDFVLYIDQNESVKKYFFLVLA